MIIFDPFCSKYLSFNSNESVTDGKIFMQNASSDFASLKSPAAMTLRSTSRSKSIGFAPPWPVDHTQKMWLLWLKESMQRMVSTKCGNKNMDKRTSFDSEIRLSCGPGCISGLIGIGLGWWIPNLCVGIEVFHLCHILHQSLVLLTLNRELLNQRRWETRRRTIPRQNAQRRCGREFLRARLGRRIRALIPRCVNQILNECNRVLVILCENPAVFDWRCQIPRLQHAVAHCTSELCKPWLLFVTVNDLLQILWPYNTFQLTSYKKTHILSYKQLLTTKVPDVS